MGVKGIGESGAIASQPAVINAVVDALSHEGVTHIDMPASPMQGVAGPAASPRPECRYARRRPLRTPFAVE